MLTKAQKEESDARRKRKVAVILIIISLVFFIGGLTIFPHTEQIKAYAEEQIYLNNWESVNEPPYAIFVQINLTGTAISVNNPITVTVTIMKNNVSNFYSHYNGIGFTNGFDPNTINSQSPELANIILHLTSNDTYVGTGKVTWLASGGTWLFLWPNLTGTGYTNYSLIEQGIAIYNIAGESDTLSIQDSITTQQLTYILIGFSVLMLQPILEAIRKIEKSPTPDNPQYQRIQEITKRKQQERNQ